MDLAWSALTNVFMLCFIFKNSHYRVGNRSSWSLGKKLKKKLASNTWSIFVLFAWLCLRPTNTETRTMILHW